MTANSAIIGSTGETLATTFLRSIGYRVYARNVRLGRDEIDVIAHDPDDNVIVFVEVKARRTVSTYAPELNMTVAKKHRLRRAMDAWVTAHGYEGGYRLDFVGVAGGRVQSHVREVELPTG